MADAQGMGASRWDEHAYLARRAKRGLVCLDVSCSAARQATSRQVNHAYLARSRDIVSGSVDTARVSTD